MSDIMISKTLYGKLSFFNNHIKIRTLPDGVMKSVNLQYNTVERRLDEMIVLPSDGPMFILIDWE